MTSRNSCLQLRIDVGQLFQRRHHEQHCAQEHAKVTGSQYIFRAWRQISVGRNINDARDTNAGQNLNYGCTRSLCEHELHIHPAVVLVYFFKLAFFEFLTVEYLYDLVGFNSLLCHMRDIAHAVLDTQTVFTKLEAQIAHEPTDCRAHDQYIQRQKPVYPEHKRHKKDHLQGVFDQCPGNRSGGISNLFDVVC